MPYALSDLRFGEISLVDDPANEHARVDLTKHSGEADQMTPEEIANRLDQVEKSLEEKDNTISELNKQLEISKAEGGMSDDEKAFYEKMEDEDEKSRFRAMSSHERKAAMSDQSTDEDVNKQQDEEIAKRLETLEKRAQDAEARAERVELEKRAEQKYPNLAGEAHVKAQVLKTIDGIEDANVQKFMNTLLDNAEASAADLTKEKGTSAGSGDDSPEQKLNSLAKSRSQDKGESFAQAFDAVIQTDEGRTLYRQSLGQ